MADIWGRTITLGSTLSGERVRVTFDEQTGILATQARIIASRRTVSQMLDLATGKLHVYAGIPDLCRVQIIGSIMSSGAFKSFIEKFGDACSGESIQVTVTPGFCTTTSGGNLVYSVDSAVLTELENVAGGEQQQYMFIGNIILQGIGPSITVS